MDRPETGGCAGTGRTGRALVTQDITLERAGGESHRRSGGRPMAGFLAQLIVAADPSLRPARLERTRAAAALYAAKRP